MSFTSADFRVTSSSFSLKDHPTELKAHFSKDELKKLLDADRARIIDLQDRLYAEKKRSLLLIFQAMDAAGKDSCIDHVLSGVNPQGCSVTGFKQPSSEELGHDFLWRHAKAVPARGMIGVHSRSHYEEVLVVKVHPEYLMGQNLPGINGPKDATAAFWEKRYASIRGWEEHLANNGVVIMKFFLHVGKKEQKKRLLERIDDPKKNWKFNLGDAAERQHFEAYMKAYEEAIAATAAPHAPWFVVPADEQWESRAVVGDLVREQLEAMDPQVPVLSAKTRTELAEAKKMLEAE
ncbi:MAG: polyphosphate kinase 2 family protein [Flavobacteriales bacterium]|nr:polyphosphate kinase 2 family protein [Flavobacteriales bacterium]